MLPVHLTQSWANSWGHSCSSSTPPPRTPSTTSNPEQGLTDPLLQQINSLSYKAAGNRNQASVPILVPKPLVCFTWQLMQKGCTEGKGMQGTDIANLAQIQPLQAKPCTGLFRRAHSSQHSFSSVKLSISMPVCINIFFLQRERRKLPGGSWAGDP